MLKTFFRVEAPRAVRAAQALFADPDDLPQVFTLIEALSLNTLARLERKMQRRDGGRQLLRTRSAITALLEDREALRRLPEGSLGRAYLAFLESEGITAAGIREASTRGENRHRHLTPGQAYVGDRLRDTHDLWHAVTGYCGDVLGETALLAFSFAQTWNPGIAIVLVVGLLKIRNAPAARALVLDGFRRGRRAEWLPGEVWEELLAQPVAVVRERLNVGAPPVYTPVRSSELRRAAA